MPQIWSRRAAVGVMVRTRADAGTATVVPAGADAAMICGAAAAWAPDDRMGHGFGPTA